MKAEDLKNIVRIHMENHVFFSDAQVKMIRNFDDNILDENELDFLKLSETKNIEELGRKEKNLNILMEAKESSEILTKSLAEEKIETDTLNKELLEKNAQLIEAKRQVEANLAKKMEQEIRYDRAKWQNVLALVFLIVVILLVVMPVIGEFAGIVISDKIALLLDKTILLLVPILAIIYTKIYDAEKLEKKFTQSFTGEEN